MLLSILYANKESTNKHINMAAPTLKTLDFDFSLENNFLASVNFYLCIFLSEYQVSLQISQDEDLSISLDHSLPK